jgi:hypothetical protein
MVNIEVNRKKMAAIAVVAVVASLVLLLSAFSYADNGMITTMKKDKVDSQNGKTSSSSFPTMERTGVKVNPWTLHEVKDGESAGPSAVAEPPGSSIINETYNGVNSAQGTVVLDKNNQSFYMITLDGNLKSIVFNEPEGTAVKFAGVTFTFTRPPSVPLPSNPQIPVVVQFQDGASETLFVQVQHDHPMTVLSSSHSGLRAGITITQGNQLMAGLMDSQGKVKLLVSTS